MGRLEDARGADAIDLIADLIDPLTEISQDEEILKLTRKNGTPVFKIVQAILRRHKDSAIQILAIIDGVEPEDYKGKKEDQRAKLLEEREKLLARLAEINKELGE